SARFGEVRSSAASGLCQVDVSGPKGAARLGHRRPAYSITSSAVEQRQWHGEAERLTSRDLPVRSGT
ncbi:MAG TPA: hypothetical protein VKB08_07665, partial [Bradyrhizobium sp.]|nr:hypothetical protein [Bradyrhizobium sp.]